MIGALAQGSRRPQVYAAINYISFLGEISRFSMQGLERCWFLALGTLCGCGSANSSVQSMHGHEVDHSLRDQ